MAEKWPFLSTSAGTDFVFEDSKMQFYLQVCLFNLD